MNDQLLASSESASTPLEPVTVIISVFNEAETIEAEIRELHSVIVERIPGSEFIVAEDGSKDGTKEIVGRLVKELGVLHSTSIERKGYAKALRDAFNLASRPYIFFSDTGRKHDPEDFWKLYPYRREYGLVMGVKTKRSDQWYRRLLTWAYNHMLSFYFGVELTDADCGFRLYQRELVKVIFNQPWLNKDLIASEIALRAIFSGFRFMEVPVSYRQRQGTSRGLPLKRVPSVIVRVLRNFPALRRELCGQEVSGSVSGKP